MFCSLLFSSLLFFDVELALLYLRNDPEFEAYRAHTDRFPAALTVFAYADLMARINVRANHREEFADLCGKVRLIFKIVPLDTGAPHSQIDDAFGGAYFLKRVHAMHPGMTHA
ncbi:hypothetical protein BH11ARM2_BH11ARM2_36650 [soil metagenome]